MPRLGRILLLALLCFSPEASGQVARIGAIRPRPQLTTGDIITLSATPSAVSFALVSRNVAAGSTPIVITTSYSGGSLISTLSLYGYFTNGSTALASGAPISYITTACILGKVPTGSPASFTSFTSTGPFGGAGASLLLYSQTAGLTLTGIRIDTLTLEINLGTLPQSPAATYTGTLNLVVQAF